MKLWRSVNHLAPCILVISLLSVAIAEADQNFAGFRHIDTTGEPPGATQASPDWGPVATDKASQRLADGGRGRQMFAVAVHWT